MQLSELAKSIHKSKIRVMYDRARLMGADDVLSFTVGEPDFATPKDIIDQANAYLSMGLTKYTPNSGIQELRDAIAEKFSPAIRPIDPQTEVMVTMGATEAILVAMQVVLNPGDEIIAIAPMFASYINQFKIVGCVPKVVVATEENGFIPTAEQIEAAIGPRTKMLLLNSPCNPTGAEIPASEL
jgi:aminotransferase